MHQRGKFWMVWSPQGRGPTYKHDSRDSADKEARLRHELELVKALPSTPARAALVAAAETELGIAPSSKTGTEG